MLEKLTMFIVAVSAFVAPTACTPSVSAHAVVVAVTMTPTT